MALVNTIIEKSKELDTWLVLTVWVGILLITDACIPRANSDYSSWMLILFTTFVSLLWGFGNKYMRITIGLLMIAMTMVLTFGFLGTQQTASGIITGSGSNAGENFVNVQFVEQYESQSETLPLYAQVTKSDMQEFSYQDEVQLTYRKLSLFGLMDLGTIVDSLDSVPVVGAGSRNVTTSNAILPIILGALPFVLLTALLIKRKIHPGYELVYEEVRVEKSSPRLELR